jgi:hypothetical protein
MGLKDVEVFFDELQRTKRAGEVRELVREIQAECRRGAERLLRHDPYYNEFMKGGIPIHNARYRCEKMSAILEVYRRWLFLPATHATYNAIGSTGGRWYLDRSRAEPMFPSEATETTGERDRLWKVFQTDLAGSPRPDVRLNLALRRCEQANTPDQRRECRRQLQALIAGYARCSAPRTCMARLATSGRRHIRVTGNRPAATRCPAARTIRPPPRKSSPTRATPARPCSASPHRVSCGSMTASV